jgi:hypothetical protein
MRSLAPVPPSELPQRPHDLAEDRERPRPAESTRAYRSAPERQLAKADVVNDVHGNKFRMRTLAVKVHASASTVGRALRQMMDDG